MHPIRPAPSPALSPALSPAFSPALGRPFVAACVVLLHLALLGWWHLMASAVRPTQTSRQAVSVVMLKPAKVQPQPPNQLRPPALVQSTPWRASAQGEARAPDTKTATAAPMATTATTATTAISVPPEGQGPSSQPAAEQAPLQAQLQPNPVPGAVNKPGDGPLNLQLPKAWTPLRAVRHPALEANQGPLAPSLEQHLKAVLGDGRWAEERLGDGRFRLRNGNRCVHWQRNRYDALNPFNAAPTPWTAHEAAC